LYNILVRGYTRRRPGQPPDDGALAVSVDLHGWEGLERQAAGPLWMQRRRQDVSRLHGCDQINDEADEMLSRGFKAQIYDVYRYLPPEPQNQDVTVYKLVLILYCGIFEKHAKRGRYAQAKEAARAGDDEDYSDASFVIFCNCALILIKIHATTILILMFLKGDNPLMIDAVAKRFIIVVVTTEIWPTFQLPRQPRKQSSPDLRNHHASRASSSKQPQPRWLTARSLLPKGFVHLRPAVVCQKASGSGRYLVWKIAPSAFSLNKFKATAVR
ncbi:hypothetical protein EJB05_34690, partial [Eragrostis curvula]